MSPKFFHHLIIGDILAGRADTLLQRSNVVYDTMNQDKVPTCLSNHQAGGWGLALLIDYLPTRPSASSVFMVRYLLTTNPFSF